MNKNQFLLTTKTLASNTAAIKIGSLNLYVANGLSHTSIADPQMEIHVLGDLYDWEHPSLSNSDILEDLLKNSNRPTNDFITATNKYSGEYIVIFIKNKNIFLFNDACGQREVYYSNDFQHFGTQVKLIGKVTELVEHTDPDAIEFYQSKHFENNKLHIGGRTHKKNIYHLLPNHFIQLSSKKVERILLPEIKNKLKVNEVAKKSSKMLSGYLEAIANRKKIIVGLTAGYDSRVLFLASLGIDCKYYVNRTANMDEDHYDIRIAKKLAALHNKKLTVIPKEWNNIEFLDSNAEQAYVDSLDFPRFSNIATDTKENEIIINGNISEVARNYYGYHKKINSKTLSILNHSPNLRFIQKQYDKWLASKDNFEKSGYHVLDMFYWEEKMGNWQSKARVELNALNRNLTTPYNSRDLLVLLLSTERRERDAFRNNLYNKIISELSNQHSSTLKLPINPNKRTTVIHLLKDFKLFNLFKSIALKIALLKY